MENSLQLQCTSLSVSCAQKEIVHDVSLAVPAGQVHALMGPNGSGKSTLAVALMGHPAYTTSGTITLAGHDITDVPIHKRAQAGLFLSFQQPHEIPGVPIATFIKAAYEAIHGAITPQALKERAAVYMDVLCMDEALWFRNLHEGFSGGQRKKLEVLQLLLLRPKVAVLDEIDSGLDVDALQAVANGLHLARKEQPTLSLLLITHYQRLLQYITPDVVHVMHQGRIANRGDAALALAIEQQGYAAYEAR